MKTIYAFVVEGSSLLNVLQQGSVLLEAVGIRMELSQRAADKGANAVVGIDLDYEVLGENNGMLMVIASGTAVTVA